MANGKKAVSSSVPRKPTLPFRRFKEWPTTIFTEKVHNELREHAMPEWIEDLNRNPIPKDVEFFIVAPVELIRGKRPSGDNAPCPMCATNKFLLGNLIWIPTLECCAVIGHCCADKASTAKANNEYRTRTKKQYEETYLLETLPLVAARMKALLTLKPVAAGAQSVYRTFRKGAASIQFQLRKTKRHGGLLRLYEVVEERGKEVTVPHDFGIMDGLAAVKTDYRPVDDLEFLIRQLGSIEVLGDEGAVIEFICSMSDKQRSAAVAILQTVDTGFDKFIDRLTDFWSFLTRENAERLNAYGTSLLNHQPFAVDFGLIKGRPSMAFRFGKARCALIVPEECHGYTFNWPKRPK